jgi:hypothetical protein
LLVLGRPILPRDFMGCFRHVMHWHSVKTISKHSGWACARFASQLKHANHAFRQLDDSLPFADLGLSKPVRLGLKSAFPSVATATDAQAKLIPAIIQGKDVMIKGDTGSGKCVKSWASLGLTMLIITDLLG